MRGGISVVPPLSQVFRTVHSVPCKWIHACDCSSSKLFHIHVTCEISHMSCRSCADTQAYNSPSCFWNHNLFFHIFHIWGTLQPWPWPLPAAAPQLLFSTPCLGQVVLLVGKCVELMVCSVSHLSKVRRTCIKVSECPWAQIFLCSLPSCDLCPFAWELKFWYNGHISFSHNPVKLHFTSSGKNLFRGLHRWRAW